VLRGSRCKYRTQKVVKKSQSGRHRTTLSGYIFATKAHIDNRKNFAALNRGRHLHSAGRPSRWALAHILVVFSFSLLLLLFLFGSVQLIKLWLSVSFWAHENMVYRIASHHIVSYINIILERPHRCPQSRPHCSVQPTPTVTDTFLNSCVILIVVQIMNVRDQ